MTVRRKIVFRLLIALLAMALALGAAEFALRAYVHGSISGAFHSFRGEAVVSTGSRADAPFVPNQELGYTLNPRNPGVNSIGFRGPDPSEWSGLSGRAVLLIGDSVSFDEGGFADLLAGELASIDPSRPTLINASIPGYTTHQERMLMEKLAPLRPARVILQYCMNDNHEFLHRITSDGTKLLTPEAKRALLPTDGGWWSRFTRWSYVGVEIQRARLRRAASRKADTFPWDDREDFCTAWRPSSWPRQELELERMQSIVSAWGGELLVVVIPIEDQLDAKLLALDRNYVLFPQQQVERICTERGIERLDLHAAFLERSEAGEPLFRDGLHLTPMGHSLVAERLTRFLRDR